MALLQSDWVPMRRGEDTDTHRGTARWGHREETAAHAPRREASGGPALPTPGARTGRDELLSLKSPELGDTAPLPGHRGSRFACRPTVQGGGRGLAAQLGARWPLTAQPAGAHKAPSSPTSTA